MVAQAVAEIAVSSDRVLQVKTTYATDDDYGWDAQVEEVGAEL